jgi:hypothetical protein
MVKEARDDQQLRIVSRGSAPSSSRGHGSGSGARGAPSGFQRGGSSRGGHYGGSFNNGGFNRGGAARNNTFNNNRYVSDLSVPLVILDSVIVGARLCHYVEFWKSLSKDPWILSSVKEGVKIDFISPPFQTVAGRNMKMGKIQSEICDREVKSLLEKGAIEKIATSTEGFISGLFVIPKRSGGFRPIVNLKSLNKFVRPEHFKMEGISSLQELIRRDDFFVKIDLKDAYLTVPVHPEDRKFFRILWGGVLYQFRCLAFGLSSAPWIFTKILKPIVNFLRRQGLRLIIYLDDILILNSNAEGAGRDYLFAVSILEKCGFLINLEKSVGTPEQVIEYLGLIIDSKSLSLSLRPEKIVEIIDLCGKALERVSVSLRDIAKILGNLAWAIKAIPFAQSHYRDLQAQYIESCKQLGGSLNSTIILDKKSKQNLTWWIANVRESNGRPMSATDPDLTIFSDASLSGWGAVMNEVSSKGPWTLGDKNRHINELELLAALNGLKCFTSQVSNLSVRLMLDNFMAVHYITKSGGTRSPALSAISADIVDWCEKRQL